MSRFCCYDLSHLPVLVLSRLTFWRPRNSLRQLRRMLLLNALLGELMFHGLIHNAILVFSCRIIQSSLKVWYWDMYHFTLFYCFSFELNI